MEQVCSVEHPPLGLCITLPAPAPAAVDRCLQARRHSAANPLAARRCRCRSMGQTGRQTDRQTGGRTYNVGVVNNQEEERALLEVR